MFKKFNVIFGLSIAVLLVGCNSRTDRNKGDGTSWGSGSFNSNGKRIYFTATSDLGASITSTGEPAMGMMMMGGRLACVSCHGTDARGGTHTMHMQVMNAPDIRWSALVNERGHESGEGDKHNQQGYGFETFRRAVVKGEHPDGDNLNQDMPRWNINDKDLTDLMNYLKSLQ